MPMNRSAIAAAMMFTAQLCSAAEESRVLSAAGAQVCRGGQVLGTIAMGDLTADEIADAAFLFQCEPANGVSELVVFLGSKGGHYKLLARTTLEQHDRRWDEVKIRSGLVIFAQGCAAACNSNWNRSFKFRYQADQMRLIGQDSNHYEMDASARSTDVVEYVNSYGSSINYLTGTAIHWRKAKTRRSTVSRTVHFAAGTNVQLEGFDADFEISGAHGYLDENFILHLAGKE